MKKYIAPVLNSIEITKPICLNTLSDPANGDPAGIRGRNLEEGDLEDFLIDEEDIARRKNVL